MPYVDLPATVSLVTAESTEVAAEGTVLSVTARVTAPANQSYTGQVWATLSLANNQMTDEIYGPVDVVLGPGETFEQTFPVTLPGTADAGSYRVNAFVGEFLGDAVDYGTLYARKVGAISPPDAHAHEIADVPVWDSRASDVDIREVALSAASRSANPDD